MMADEKKEIFDRKEVYVGRDFGGTTHDITPDLILHSAVYATLGWYLPNIYGNLHARQEWNLFAPVMVGDRLTTRAVIVDRYLKRDREYVVNEVLVGNASGQIVSRSRTHQSFLLPEQTKQGFVVDKSREKDSSRSFKIGERGGDPIDAPMRQINEEMCVAFSGPARNYHNDRQKAVELGFPEIVVQGMLSVCLVAEMMTKRFGLGFLYGGKMDLRLVNVVWGNDVTGPKGLIVERHPEGKRSRAEVEVWCDKADGTKTIVGSASALEL